MHRASILLRTFMRHALLATLVLGGGAPAVARSQSPVDSAFAAFIATIRAVDNHTHVNTTVARDSEFDALPLDGLPPFALPARIDPNNPELLAGYKELYGYEYTDLSDAHRAELRAAMERVAREQGDRFPEWVRSEERRVGKECRSRWAQESE